MGTLIFAIVMFCLLALYAVCVMANAKARWYQEGKRDAIQAYKLTGKIPNKPHAFNPNYKQEYIDCYMKGFNDGIEEIYKKLNNIL